MQISSRYALDVALTASAHQDVAVVSTVRDALSRGSVSVRSEAVTTTAVWRGLTVTKPGEGPEPLDSRGPKPCIPPPRNLESKLAAPFTEAPSAAVSNGGKGPDSRQVTSLVHVRRWQSTGGPYRTSLGQRRNPRWPLCAGSSGRRGACHGLRGTSSAPSPTPLHCGRGCQDGRAVPHGADHDPSSHAVIASTIAHCLRKQEVPLRQLALSPADLKPAVAPYRAGWSLARIGGKYGTTDMTVRRAIAEHGVEIWPQNGYF